MTDYPNTSPENSIAEDKAGPGRQDAAAVPPTKFAYAIDEVCHALSIGRTKLYELLKSGKLRKAKIGRRTVVLRNDLMDFLSDLQA